MTEANREIRVSTPFLQEQFDKFCKMVESFAEHLLTCAGNEELAYDYRNKGRLDEKKEGLLIKYGRACSRWNEATTAGDKRKQRRAERTRLEIEAQLNKLPSDIARPKPGCVVYEWADRRIGYDFIALPLQHPEKEVAVAFRHFWVTLDVRNPLPWLLTPLGCYQDDLSREDRLMCDSVVLSIVRDQNSECRLYGHMPANPIYSDKPYNGRYFRRDEFCARLWEDLAKDRKRVEDASRNVLDYLESKTQPQTEPEGAGQGSDTNPQAEAAGDEDGGRPVTGCIPTEDFSSVVWYGHEYHFIAKQALCVKLLWAEWEKDPDAELGLREKTIGEKISSASDNYRLLYTFREKGRQMHPAWGQMIHARGDGSFYLAPPPTKKARKKRTSRKRPSKK